MTVALHPLDQPGPRAIVDAAIEAMSLQGYHGTSIRDIAERAGMSNAALYHHFASKQDLLFRIMDRGIDELHRSTVEALAAVGDDPAEQLSAMVRVHVLAHTRDRKGSFIGNTELRSLEPEHRAVIVAKRDRQQRLFDDVVRAGTRAGRFTTPHPREAARAIVTMGTAVAGWYRPEGRLGPAAVAERYVVMALALVGHRPD